MGTVALLITNEAPLSLLFLHALAHAPFHQTVTIKLAVLEELADGVLLSSAGRYLPLRPRTYSPAALEVVAGDAIVAGGHGAGIAVGAGRIVVGRIQSMALA